MLVRETDAVPSPSSSAQEARRALGQRLREIRKETSLTARALAKRAGWHESKCSRLENGKTRPSEEDLRVWTLHCGALDQLDDLIAFVRNMDGMYVEWHRVMRGGLRRLQESDVSLYEATRRFRIYEPGVIPGLLQTPGYAAALMGDIIDFHQLPDDTKAAVAVRMERQRVLCRGDHTFAMVLEESALRTRIGGAEVMAAQLGHLLVAASLPRVSLGIIPASVDRRMCPAEGFWVFDDDRVKVELVSAEVTVTQPQEIELYARTFAGMSALAVHGGPARNLITSAINSL
ncbi:helix-turn-helix domain-containing protein [Streptomyces buecherae]|uniref:helix-turn-helix domain-containing protein n=1 Tax=Streptomyces buecherae TaxID=2763006 RepID=UPI00337806C9